MDTPKTWPVVTENLQNVEKNSILSTLRGRRRYDSGGSVSGEIFGGRRRNQPLVLSVVEDDAAQESDPRFVRPAGLETGETVILADRYARPRPQKRRGHAFFRKVAQGTVEQGKVGACLVPSLIRGPEVIIGSVAIGQPQIHGNRLAFSFGGIDSHSRQPELLGKCGFRELGDPVNTVPIDKLLIQYAPLAQSTFVRVGSDDRQKLLRTRQIANMAIRKGTPIAAAQIDDAVLFISAAQVRKDTL